MFDDKFDSYYDNSNFYDGKIIGGFQWGGGIEYMLRPEYGIEILYLRQDTHAPTTYATGSTGPVNIKETDFLGIRQGRYQVAGTTGICGAIDGWRILFWYGWSRCRSG